MFKICRQLVTIYIWNKQPGELLWGHDDISAMSTKWGEFLPIFVHYSSAVQGKERLTTHCQSEKLFYLLGAFFMGPFTRFQSMVWHPMGREHWVFAGKTNEEWWLCYKLTPYISENDLLHVGKSLERQYDCLLSSLV